MIVNELALLCGDPIPVNNDLQIYPATLRDIKNLSMPLYEQYLSVFMLTKDKLLKMIPIEMYLAVEKFTSFQLLLTISALIPDIRNLLENSLKFFLRCNAIALDLEKKVLVVGFEIKNQIVEIDDAIFDDIIMVVKIQNNLIKKEEVEGKPADEKTRELMEKRKRLQAVVEEVKRKQEQGKVKAGNVTAQKTVTFEKLIMTVILRSGGAITPDTVWDLTIYTFYKLFNQIQQIEEFERGWEQQLAGIKLQNKLQHWLL